jgi:hypothetical protein
MLSNACRDESMAGSECSHKFLAYTNEDRTLPCDAEEGVAVQACPPTRARNR